MRKILIITASILLILIIGLMFVPKKSNKTDYSKEKVERRTIIETVEASGTINPVKTVNIGTLVSGTISAIYVDYNSKVKKGQLLAEIDPSLFQAQVDKARGDLAAAQAGYQQVKSNTDYLRNNYARYSRLYKKNYVSKSDVEIAQAEYRSNTAELQVKQASIQQAQATLTNNLTNLKYTKIISPVDGIVVSRAVNVGQSVAASFQTPTLFLVAQDLSEMQIEVSVSEADIGKIKPDQEVKYTLDGYPGKVFLGKVTQVRISPTTVSNVVTYTVIVSVDNDDNILIPGMTANVEIITKKSENVLSVSTKALKFSPKEITQGQKFEKQGIWVLEKKKPTRKEIETGSSDGEFTEIQGDGIVEGTEVLKGKDMNLKGKPKMPHGPMGIF